MFKSLKLIFLIFMVIPLLYGLERDHAPHKTRGEKGTEVLEHMLGNDQQFFQKKEVFKEKEIKEW